MIRETGTASRSIRFAANACLLGSTTSASRFSMKKAYAALKTAAPFLNRRRFNLRQSFFALQSAHRYVLESGRADGFRLVDVSEINYIQLAHHRFQLPEVETSELVPLGDDHERVTAACRVVLVFAIGHVRQNSLRRFDSRRVISPHRCSGRE